jgi:transcriptional regulator with XRE-family HTH domain
MIEIGQTLQRARRTLDLSLEEIARTTRIPRATLEAIEAGDHDDLPAEVFVRGFIRSFALAVEVPPVPLLERFAESRRAQAEPAEANPVPGMRLSDGRLNLTEDRFALLLSDGVSNRSSMHFGPAALVLVALAMFFAAWVMVGTDTSRSPMTAEPTNPMLHQNHVDGTSITVGLDAR